MRLTSAIRTATSCRPSASGRNKRALLHVSLNRIRSKDKNMQQFKVLQRPLRV
ncbi:hypothetical protein GHK62_09045 [Sinorhizobium terangae]|uniref:Uncharacterized protein n=1 Tax=Sinorhizobium terangae TaxID=110322 RepID=A0A6N7LAM5_SINTE|nr:hypothetical protein [Sinorhizobium terangae]